MNSDPDTQTFLQDQRFAAMQPAAACLDGFLDSESERKTFPQRFAGSSCVFFFFFKLLTHRVISHQFWAYLRQQ